MGESLKWNGHIVYYSFHMKKVYRDISGTKYGNADELYVGITDLTWGDENILNLICGDGYSSQ